MNFNIVDGDRDYLDKVPEFIEHYNSKYYSIPKLIEVMGLTRNEYRKLRKHCIEEDLINLRRSPNRKKKKTYKTAPKNYYCTRKGKYISFYIVKNGVYYCTVKTREQAEEVVRRLKACDWDKSKAESIKEAVVNGE